jgi:hypothetical protein
MGEMADMYNYGYWGPEYKERHDNFRNTKWSAKEADIQIRKMGDRHLLNAFKISGDQRLRDEMLMRLFERTLNESQN